MEVGYGNYGEPRSHGCPRAGSYGDHAGNSSYHWSTYASSGLCRIPLPRQPLALGIGHVMDLGTACSGGGVTRARGGRRRSCLGDGRIAGTAAPRVAVVVIREFACEYRSSFLPITKCRPLVLCLPICLPISSRKSSLSTAILLTERPISLKKWGHESSWSLDED